MVGRTPHDKLFKRIFKDPRYAAEELREALPEAVVQALDWTTLKREPETHVEQPGNARRPLPLVLPVLLTHAHGGWKAETRFTALFTQEALALAPWAVPDFEYAVDDLANLDQAALRERPASDPVRLTLWALRDAAAPPSSPPPKAGSKPSRPSRATPPSATSRAPSACTSCASSTTRP